MDYKQKYIKYKNKYLKIKKNQIGGGEDETYLYYDGKQIRGKLFTSQTEGKPIELQNLNENVRLFINDLQQSKYMRITHNTTETNEKYTAVWDNGSKVIIVTDKKINIQAIITYDNNKIIKKEFYLYITNQKISIILTEFQNDDETFIIGTGTFELKNNEIIITGICTISRKPWIINFRIKQIKCIDTDIFIDYPIDKIENLPILLAKDNSYGTNFEICKSIANRVEKPDILYDKQQLYNDIVNTICKKIIYIIPKETLKILNTYTNLVKLIIGYDMEKINLTINDESTNEIPKYIPSTIDNENILFENKKGKFISVSDKFKIIFDSGNDSVTIIGRDIVKELDLNTSNGCIIRASGIGGPIKQCGEYVELKFRFNKNYPMTNNKVYNILGFIDDSNLKDTVLFGHSNGLDLLFNDNYSIKNRFDPDSDKLGKYKSNRRLIKETYEKMNNILRTFIERKDINIFKELNFDPDMIHTYYTDVPMQLVSNMYANLAEAKKVAGQLENLNNKSIALEILEKYSNPKN